MAAKSTTQFKEMQKMTNSQMITKTMMTVETGIHNQFKQKTYHPQRLAVPIKFSTKQASLIKAHKVPTSQTFQKRTPKNNWIINSI